MLDDITPVILTRNEAPNISRTLSRLIWARDIVIVDSCSTDQTVEIASRFPQVRVARREFDTHATQWEFALHSTGIQSESVLALDADYVLSDALLEELARLAPDAETAGYLAPFTYVVNGRRLRGSAYPPTIVLYRRSATRYVQDGHTQRAVVSGRVQALRGAVLHDDRKSLDRWCDSQRRYMKLEAEKLAATDWRELRWPDRLRKLKFVAPVAIFLYCLFYKRAMLDGTAGLYYSMQRAFSEVLLSLYLFEAERCTGTSRAGAGEEAVQPQ